MPVGRIESLDHEARGITRLEGKTIFVEGALPGELVEYSSFRRKPSFELAVVERILESSSLRNSPPCPHFGVCGGCSMQHFDPSGQVAVKQRILEDNLWHIARLRAERLLPPIYGQPWAYRHRARLSVRYVPKKGGVLVGFHEKRSSYVADMKTCAVLPRSVSDLLMPLRTLVEQLSIRQRLPQIEVSLGAESLVLVLRVLEPPNSTDLGLMREFARTHAVEIHLQPKGPDSVVRLWPESSSELSYRLPDFGIDMRFSPTDFTQVNHAINAVLVRRAVDLLAPMKGERIADMFCGLGNFSLPIARRGAAVIGVEGSSGLVRRAERNSVLNGLGELAEFRVANLFAATPEWLDDLGRFDKMLIDPPREGAAELVKALGSDGLARVVYVSCNPSTLARDAAILVSLKGYRLRAAGVVNMFPQTSHVESIAVFERQ